MTAGLLSLVSGGSSVPLKLSGAVLQLILGVAFVIGIGGAVGYLALLSLFPIIAFVAAAIYLVDVRPKLLEIQGKSR